MERSLEAQYRALRENCGLWARSATSIVVSGEDRHRLLNGLLTCDVGTQAPGQGAQGFFTDVKGHILSEVVVRSRAESLYLQLPEGMAAPIAAHIDKYILADRVEVRPPIEHDVLTLLGPRSAAWISTVLDGIEIPGAPWDHVEVEIGDRSCWLTADGYFGMPALSCWMPVGAVDASAERLLSGPADRKPLWVGLNAVDIVRIEEGMPLFGRDYGPENLPQESGLETAISYSKGCYLGQEVVSRLHYRGQVARRVSLLEGRSAEVPKVGGQLLLDGREAGVISSVAQSPAKDQISILAMLQRRALESGTQLQLEDGGSMRVI